MTPSNEPIGIRDKKASIKGDLMRRHDEDVKKLRVFEEEHGATPTFGLVLDIEWAERIIASDMYFEDARAIANALALVLDCPVVLPLA